MSIARFIFALLICEGIGRKLFHFTGFNMERIELTEEEYNCGLEHISNLRNGLLVDYMPKGDDDPLVTLLRKATALEERLDAFDERMATRYGDLVHWIILKYQIQEGIETLVD